MASSEEPQSPGRPLEELCAEPRIIQRAATAAAEDDDHDEEKNENDKNLPLVLPFSSSMIEIQHLSTPRLSPSPSPSPSPTPSVTSPSSPSPFHSSMCLICLTPLQETIHQNERVYTLPCSHQYCFTCLESYLESNILEGKISMKCFHIENYNDAEGKSLPACNAVIPETTVKEILINKPTTYAKYTRFSFLKSNPYGRECPSCSHLQIGDPNRPQMSCESCGRSYCLTHALAHPKEVTCEAYEQSISAETQINVDAITLISKPCPGCGIFVSKSDGCNHMKVHTLPHTNSLSS